MPGTDLTITGKQRDALYELVTNHVGDLASVWLAMRKGDYETAERKALEFMGDFRLLADLDWHPEDSRGTVRLTMPARGAGGRAGRSGVSARPRHLRGADRQARFRLGG